MRYVAKVNQRSLDDITAGLRYVSSPPFARKAFAIPKIKERILDYLRSIFPISDPRWGHVRHLITGFRAYDVPERNNVVGFVIRYGGAGAGNARTQEILQALEKGSRGYYRYPEDAGPSGYGLFTFFPGDGRGDRHGVGPPDFAMRKRIHIPARPGIHYMEKTLAFAQQLILEAKPEYFKQVKEAIRTKKR